MLVMEVSLNDDLFSKIYPTLILMMTHTISDPELSYLLAPTWILSTWGLCHSAQP